MNIRITLLLVLCHSYASAQKLPKTQETTLTAPPTVKIDGRADEWRNLAAFNPALQAYYSVATNDSNVYLVVHIKDWSVITKILRGGITFSVNAAGKKDEKGMPAITFLNPPKGGVPAGQLKMIMAKGMAEPTPAPLKEKQQDSVRYTLNRRYIDPLKDIRVAWLNGVPEQSLSIYNDDGIKVAAQFNGNSELTYELSAPLSFFNLKRGATGRYAYHLRFNGLNSQVTMPETADAVMAAKISAEMSQMTQRFSTTDMWGSLPYPAK